MPEFVFLAGNLALDLVNTEQISASARIDLLDSPVALLDWLSKSGAIASAEINAAKSALLADRAAGRLLQQAKELRAAVRRMAEAIVGHRVISEETIGVINSILRRSSPRVPELVRQGRGYVLEWRNQGASAGAFLAPVAEAAARLLAEGDHSRVRKCANPDCILYLYDATRSRTRHWCSMQGCGNRAKAARFYRRQRS